MHAKSQMLNCSIVIAPKTKCKATACKHWASQCQLALFQKQHHQQKHYQATRVTSHRWHCSLQFAMESVNKLQNHELHLHDRQQLHGITRPAHHDQRHLQPSKQCSMFLRTQNRRWLEASISDQFRDYSWGSGSSVGLRLSGPRIKSGCMRCWGLSCELSGAC